MYNSTLKAAIEAAIHTPAEPKINGSILQQKLLEIISAIDAGAVFKGVATPASSPSGESNCFYLASTEGTYTNFLDTNGNAIVLAEGEVALLASIYNNDVLRWTKNLVPGRGENSYLHIMYAATQPTQDRDMHDTFTSGDKWIGICADANDTAPDKYDAYQWAKFVGDNGAPGADGHNPNLGTYLLDTTTEPPYPIDAPATAQDGDYIVVIDEETDPQNPTQRQWIWDSSLNDNAGGWKATTVDPGAQFATREYVSAIGIDAEPTAGSNNLVKSGGIVTMYGKYVNNNEFLYVEIDNDGKILWGIKSDGNVYFGKGVPPQVVNYFEGKLSELPSFDNYDDIVTFLGSLIEGDRTLQELLQEISGELSGKVDKVEGKELIDSNVSNMLSVEDNSEYLDVETDNSGKLLGGRKKDGTRTEYAGFEINETKFGKIYDIHNNIEMTLDSDGKIISYRKKDGTLVENRVEAQTVKIKSAEIGNIDIIVKDSVDRNFLLPSFYHEDNYIDSIVLNLQRVLLQMGRGDIFGFITDTHPMNKGNIRSGKIFQYIASQIPLQKVLFGGDLGPTDATYYGTGTSALDGLAKSIMQQTERLYAPCRTAGLSVAIARGNHDFASSKDKGSTTFDENGFIATRESTRHMTLIYNDAIVTDDSNPKSNYYYFDNKVQKIRYIVVDTSDSVDRYPQEGSSSNVTMATSDTQIKWIVEQAILTTPSDYSIIFMGHVVPSAVAYGAPLSSSHPWSEASIYRINSIISAIQNKTSVSVTLSELTETYDFTDFAPNVIAYFAGHLHYDSQTIEDGVLYYCSAGDCFGQEGSSSRVESQLFGAYSAPRLENSITEDTLNVIIVDVDNLIIHLKRIGSGVHKKFNLTPITVSAGNTTTLVSSLSGTIKWASYDAKILGPDNSNMFSHTITSINNTTGVLTGLTTGESVAVAYSKTENTIEFFYVVVQ